MVWDGDEWIVAGGGGSAGSVTLLGINATADTTDRLSVKSDASLFSHDDVTPGSGDHRMKISKAAVSDTASVLFQTDFSGRAEFGLAGDDDWHVKVSPDGTTWHEALVADRSSGRISFPNTRMREVLSADRTYYVNASSGFDSNDGLGSGTAFATIQKAIDVIAALDTSIYAVTVQVAAGTYTTANALKRLVGAGSVVIEGDTSTPSNVHVDATGDAFTSEAPPGQWEVKGFKLTASVNCLDTSAACGLSFRDIEFGMAGSYHIAARAPGTFVLATGNYSISGAAAVHLSADGGGVINIFNRAVTVSGTPNFSAAFAYCQSNSTIVAASATFTGSATGSRYRVTRNGVILADSDGNKFPGDAAGADTTGGVYA